MTGDVHDALARQLRERCHASHRLPPALNTISVSAQVLGRLLARPSMPAAPAEDLMIARHTKAVLSAASHS
jgi:hypothetical protein